VLLFRLWLYANSLAPNDAWPTPNYRLCLLCAVWGAFPFASGLVSRICDPHHPFLAVFEGASGPALFLMVARDFPL
jgi:hypothetical protein